MLNVLRRNLVCCSNHKSKHLLQYFATKKNCASRIMGKKLVWVDLEMTGLDVEKDRIIEMACLITDSQLNLIAEGPDLIIHQPDSVLDAMCAWCVEHHGQSGLTKSVQESIITEDEAQETMLKFIQKYTEPKHCILAGNSVHADKVFLDKYMPKFMNHLHYRIIDVSTVKELCSYWYEDIRRNVPKKAGNHRALSDIKESLEELKFYRASIFK